MANVNPNVFYFLLYNHFEVLVKFFVIYQIKHIHISSIKA